MKVVVVGAGPAGVRAVEQLVRSGLSPTWLDEAADGGGRIYQRPPAGFRRDARALYGFEATRAAALHATFDALAPRTDWRPGTLAWHIRPQARRLYAMQDGAQQEIGYDALLLCTGAMDRVIPLPGWTRPGAATLGAAQIALKAQGCAIGRRVAFLGTGPLLWLAAYQYARAGVEVAAVLDTTRFAGKLAAAPGLWHAPATLATGLYYTAWLRARRLPVTEGIVPLAIEGDADGVTGLRWRDSAGRDRATQCDAVAMGWGLKPEAQLADLAGLPFDFDALQHNWVPRRDAAGRAPVPGIYLAGDGAGIAGAEVAEIAGARAALALLEDAGQGVDAALVTHLDRALRRQARFRAALDRAFPFPSALAAGLADDTILCRCEAITAGELRAAAAEESALVPAPEVNRAKAYSRVGMGRCQGRVCGPAGAEVLAAALGCTVAEVGRLRGQPPVKPIPITAMERVAG
ncbi:FAD/NAD(P)-dependent oxidoreductase [Paracraurococcus ruber]|uniref:FAD/NAD(P)-binding oxidoreductase n=1 Tax=Paracraurococcus ruber TaxID=77675 RepID=A0ABS1CRE8_9PROT|nr:FAD/NAD(P)-binding oxidoreductase [Paracraurococcus ruber]MBK1657026.1 FAD/NAD(P)-binding oxidoreductase [Paracraurococcus ruber]TDG34278.1 FAD/NAD(P)-binding oxidoreductase [Paracraurococcus ruber]